MSTQFDNTTSKTTLCIFCENELGPDTKPEHILLDALGGRKTTQKAVCSTCNQSFGSSIDNVLPEQLRFLRNMFQMKSGSGDPPPGLKNVSTASGPVDIDAAGTLTRPKGKPFTVAAQEDGKWQVGFKVRDQEQLEKYVPHAAAAMKMPGDKLWSQIEGQEAILQNEYPGAIHSQLNCGGPEALRSMVKSSLALLATVTGTAVLRDEPFAMAREFVKIGSTAYISDSTGMDARQIPDSVYDYLLSAHGPMFNLIYVKSNADGRTIAYFHLFNIFSWQMVLSESGGPENIEIALASNPLDTIQWDDHIAEKSPIDFDWLNTPDDTERFESATKRISAVLQYRQTSMRQKVIADIVTKVFDKHYQENELIEDDAKGKAAFTELAHELSLAILQISSEQKIVISRPKNEDN